MKRGEGIFCWILMGFAVLCLLASLQITPLAELTITADGAYPIFISCLSLIFGGFMLLEQHRKWRTEEKHEGPFVLSRDIVVMIGLLVLYIVGVLILHYILATLLFTVLAITYLADRDWKRGLLVGFIATFWIVLILKYCFSVILP